jgi:hypothetical protein
MGKGIVILFYLIMIPLSAILFFAWVVGDYFQWKKQQFVYILITIWVIFIGGTGLLFMIEPFLKPMVVTPQDIYGNYVIDKSIFPGKQAEWQYDNFRFKITKNDELVFEYHIYNNWKREVVNISYTSGYYDTDKDEYCNKRIILHSNSTNHHIIHDNPTLFRKDFNRFYYVFKSKRFGNVFFVKE